MAGVVTGIANIFPPVVFRPLVSSFPSNGGVNPLDSFPQNFTYTKSAQTVMRVIRRTGATVNYAFTISFTGGTGGPQPGDPQNYVAYLNGTAIEEYPNPGLLLTVTWPVYPQNYYVITTNDGGRAYTLQFSGYMGLPPTLYKSAGAAIPIIDTVDVITTTGVAVAQ